jgi:hypothetical protein
VLLVWRGNNPEREEETIFGYTEEVAPLSPLTERLRRRGSLVPPTLERIEEKVAVTTGAHVLVRLR